MGSAPRPAARRAPTCDDAPVRTIDLNADLGEGFGRWRLTDDEGLLDVVTSANVACGFHAGDAATMRRVVGLCADRGVTVGAQVSYRDLAGFGRRFVDVAPAELTAEVMYQVGALRAFADAAGTRVAYVKPHGALYNAVVRHEEQAAALVDAVLALGGPGDELVALGLPGSARLRRAQESGIRCVTEGFADRAYTPEGTLVPRAEAGAVLADGAVTDQAASLAAGRVTAVDGSDLAMPVGSVCVHGDSATAVAHARAVRDALATAGARVAPFA